MTNWNNKEQVLEAVKQDGNNLQYASQELQSDKQLVITAVKQDRQALKFASSALQERYENNHALVDIDMHLFIHKIDPSADYSQGIDLYKHSKQEEALSVLQTLSALLEKNFLDKSHPELISLNDSIAEISNIIECKKKVAKPRESEPSFASRHYFSTINLADYLEGTKKREAAIFAGEVLIDRDIDLITHGTKTPAFINIECGKVIVKPKDSNQETININLYGEDAPRYKSYNAYTGDDSKVLTGIDGCTAGELGLFSSQSEGLEKLKIMIHGGRGGDGQKGFRGEDNNRFDSQGKKGGKGGKGGNGGDGGSISSNILPADAICFPHDPDFPEASEGRGHNGLGGEGGNGGNGGMVGEPNPWLINSTDGVPGEGGEYGGSGNATQVSITALGLDQFHISEGEIFSALKRETNNFFNASKVQNDADRKARVAYIQRRVDWLKEVAVAKKFNILEKIADMVKENPHSIADLQQNTLAQDRLDDIHTNVATKITQDADLIKNGKITEEYPDYADRINTLKERHDNLPESLRTQTSFEEKMSDIHSKLTGMGDEQKMKSFIGRQSGNISGEAEAHYIEPKMIGNAMGESSADSGEILIPEGIKIGEIGAEFGEESGMIAVGEMIPGVNVVLNVAIALQALCGAMTMLEDSIQEMEAEEEKEEEEDRDDDRRDRKIPRLRPKTPKRIPLVPIPENEFLGEVIKIEAIENDDKNQIVTLDTVSEMEVSTSIGAALQALGYGVSRIIKIPMSMETISGNEMSIGSWCGFNSAPSEEDAGIVTDYCNFPVVGMVSERQENQVNVIDINNIAMNPEQLVIDPYVAGYILAIKDQETLSNVEAIMPLCKNKEEMRNAAESGATVDIIRPGNPRAPHVERAQFINVGQGNCTLLCNKTDKILSVIDCGGDNAAYGASPALSKIYPVANSIPIILSHFDADHFNLLTSIVAVNSLQPTIAAKATNILCSQQALTGRTASSFRNGLDQRGVSYNIDANNNIIPRSLRPSLTTVNLPKDVRVDALTMRGGKNSNQSLVVSVQNGNGINRLFLPGDASFRNIRADFGNIFDKDYTHIVATHHGSTNHIGRSLDPAIVHPPRRRGPIVDNGDRFVIFSYGAHNRYHHSMANGLGQYINQGWTQGLNTARLGRGNAQCQYIQMDFENSLSQPQYIDNKRVVNIVSPHSEAELPLNALDGLHDVSYPDPPRVNVLDKGFDTSLITRSFHVEETHRREAETPSTRVNPNYVRNVDSDNDHSNSR